MTKNERIHVSVVIPAYNASRSIADALDSIVNQTSPDIKEIIVVDDGSTDQTADIVKNYINNKTQLSINLIQTTNKGVSAARNTGIKNAAGDWIGLLDADDKWLPEKITEQVKIIKQHPEVSALGCNRDSINKRQGKKVDDGLYKLNVYNQLWSYWPSTPTLLFKKNIITKIGLYDETRSHAEDGDFLLRIAKNYGVYYTVKSLVETADKPAYGHSGLSGNNKSMHYGSLINVKNVYERHEINYLAFLTFTLWENIKYLRRIIITNIQNNKLRSVK